MSDDKPEPIPRKTPKKRSGPSMREQIAARRRAEAEAAAGGGDAKPAAAPKAKRGTGPSKPAAERKATRPTSRSSARRAGGGRSRRGDDDEDEDGEERPRGRRGRAQKKSSPMPLIAAGVLLAAVGGGAWYAMGGGGEAEASDGQNDEQTAENGGEATEGAGEADANAAAEGATENATDGGSEGAPAEDSTPADGEAAPAGDDPAGADEPASADEPAAAPAEDDETAPIKPEPADEGEPVDASAAGAAAAMINGEVSAKLAEKIASRRADVDALEPFDKPAGIDDEAWNKLVADAAKVREGGGASVKRAAKRLAEAGKHAFPAVVNELISMDLDDPRTFANGKQLTDALDRARGSSNVFGFGWQPSEDLDSMPPPPYVSTNLSIIKQLHAMTHKIQTQPDYWAKKVDKTQQYKESQEIQGKAAEDALSNDEFDTGGLSNDDFDFGDGE